MFQTNVILGLILVRYFASHVMCRKLASYKSAGNFPTKCFLGTNLNTTVSILNMCRKFSYKLQENFLHMSTSAGKFPTHKCKMLHKCRKISCTYSKNLDFSCQVQETCFLCFNFQLQVHLATDFHISFGTCSSKRARSTFGKVSRLKALP